MQGKKKAGTIAPACTRYLDPSRSSRSVSHGGGRRVEGRPAVGVRRRRSKVPDVLEGRLRVVEVRAVVAVGRLELLLEAVLEAELRQRLAGVLPLRRGDRAVERAVARVRGGPV